MMQVSKMLCLTTNTQHQQVQSTYQSLESKAHFWQISLQHLYQPLPLEKVNQNSDHKNSKYILLSFSQNAIKFES